MDLTIDSLWEKIFVNTPVSKLKELGKEKFLNYYLETAKNERDDTPDVERRIEMAALIDVIETRDDPLGGMNFAQTVSATKQEVARGVEEWIQNYANDGYPNISSDVKYLMCAHYLGRLEKGTFASDVMLEILLEIEQTVTGGR